MGEMEHDAHDAMEHQMELGGIDEWGEEHPAANPLPGQTGYDNGSSFMRWLNGSGEQTLGLGSTVDRLHRKGRLHII